MDFLPMKGIEYLLVIGYLLLLIPFWYLLMGTREAAMARAEARPVKRPRSWFSAPEHLFFHPGHSWAERLEGNRVRVGMDDFAHRLVGPVDRMLLPRPGDELTVGDDGWWLEADGKVIPVLSPVTGRVSSVNEKAAMQNGRGGEDPYRDGWLMEVEVPSTRTALRNLLHGEIAQMWTSNEARRLSERLSPELGTVLADGGTPVSGLARAIDGDRWWELAAEMLLVDDEIGSSD